MQYASNDAPNLLQIETINTNASFYEYNLRFVPKAIAQ
jgi:hypothetical protein